MNGGPSRECQHVCEQLTLPDGSHRSSELAEHLALCEHCRQWEERTRVAVEGLRRLAATLDGLEPVPMTGPWQHQPLVETTGDSAMVLRRYNRGRRGMLAPIAWLATAAAVALALTAVQSRPWTTLVTNSSTLAARQSTLVWSPVSEGHPSRAGIAYLANLQLPTVCLTRSGLLPPDSEGLHQQSFDCCTRCHASGTGVGHTGHTHQVLNTCGICHQLSLLRETPATACSSRDCSTCHMVAQPAQG